MIYSEMQVFCNAFLMKIVYEAAEPISLAIVKLNLWTMSWNCTIQVGDTINSCQRKSVLMCCLSKEG